MGIFHFFGQVRGYLEVFALTQYTKNRTILQKKKSCPTLKLFSSSNMFFIRLFLANAWGKNWGSLCLFPHKLLWKMDMVLRSRSGWIICAAETGARYKIAPIVFEVCTRDQACFRLFLCVWYRQHRDSNLKRVQQIPRNEGCQDLMIFLSYDSLFWTIL